MSGSLGGLENQGAWPSHWEHSGVSGFGQSVLVSFSFTYLSTAHSCPASVDIFLSNVITIILLTTKQSHKCKWVFKNP